MHNLPENAQDPYLLWSYTIVNKDGLFTEIANFVTWFLLYSVKNSNVWINNKLNETQLI